MENTFYTTLSPGATGFHVSFVYHGKIARRIRRGLGSFFKPAED